MKQLLYSTVLLVVTCVLMSSKTKKRVSMLGKEVPAFTLTATGGKRITLGDNNAKGYIVVFTCNHCPFAKLYTQRLNDLYSKYNSKGVPLIAINPMDSLVYEDENMAGMKKWAKSQHYKFPYLQDGTQAVAKAFYALHTPQAYVVWKEGNKWVIKYNGAIDDNGQHPESAKPYVANAVDALLQGKQVTEAENLSFGCAIHYR